MGRLMDVLVELAVPKPSGLEELNAFGDDLYSRVDRADLADVEVVEAAALNMAPEFVALAEAASRAQDKHSTQLLKAAAVSLPKLTRLVFSVTADVVLQSPALLARHGRELAGALAARVDDLRAYEPLQAYAYLEVLTRLGFALPSAKFRALELLSSITLDDPVDLLERVPRLIGLALDQWREDALSAVLDLLLQNESSRADALFELAQVKLRSALEAASMESIVVGLAEARADFTTVEAMEEARDDATLFRSALDVLVEFAAAPTGTGEDASASMEALSTALARRRILSMRSPMGGWAEPRRQAEAEWFALARTLRDASAPLAQPSWLTPVETLSRVLAAYQASRSVTVLSAEGLRVVLEPTVEAAFVRREGLLAHLRGAIDSGLVPEDDADAAKRLFDTVSSAMGGTGGGDAVGKVWTAAPALAAELGVNGDTAIAQALARTLDENPALVARLNQEAANRASARARGKDPVVDMLLTDMLRQLDDCEDLVNTVREEFVEVLTEVLRFAAERAGASRENWGKDVAYLFPPQHGKPAFTEDYLQKDMFSWLLSSGLAHYCRMEERDIAAGRADITVHRDHRFVIEVKRELHNATRSALLAAYGGQSAAYSVAGPRVSVAMVLDLTDHSHGMPSLTESVWVEKVPICNAGSRHVVTVVIRGNRQTPRQTQTG